MYQLKIKGFPKPNKTYEYIFYLKKIKIFIFNL